MSLVIAALLAGSVTGRALADGKSAQNADRWAKHPALQPFNVSSEELPSSLFLVRTRGRLPETDGVVVHGTYNGLFLVSGDESAVRSLSQRGCKVIPLRDLPEVPQPVAREWVWINTPNPAIAAMVDQVQWEGVRAKIQRLVAFRTRYCLAPNHHAVAYSLCDVFETYGFQPVLWSFEYAGTTMFNVMATQTGTAYPDSYVIICGHFDSTSQIPMYEAPGADDNGTGTSAVLTAAEILSQHTFEYSIQYICFDTEEPGCVGSMFYARWAQRNDVDIVAVLNFDMLGYWVPGLEDELEIETKHATQWLGEAVVNAADLYTDTPYELHVQDYIAWGDHWSFLQCGYAAVNHEESFDWVDPDFSPYYHTTFDLLEHVDPGFTVGNIKVGVAALATLAGYVPPIPAPSCSVVPLSINFGNVALGDSSDATFTITNTGGGNLTGSVSESCDYFRVVSGGGSYNLAAAESLVVTVRFLPTTAGDFVCSVETGSDLCDDVDFVGKGDEGIPVAVQAYQSHWTDNHVEVIWKLSEKDVDARFDVFRKMETDGDYNRIQNPEINRKGDEFVFEDRSTEPGKTYTYRVAILEEGRVVTSFETTLTTPSLEVALDQNHPNPFNPSTTISFTLPEGIRVNLSIYDLEGKLVANLLDQVMSSGFKEVTWNGRDAYGSFVSSGVYFYRLEAGKKVLTKKMVLLK